MSSDEELHDIDDGQELNGGTSMDAAKRRKLLRACDICRRKKIRCDAHSKPNMTKCSHCTTYKLDCTFVEGAKKRSPPKAYIDDLEKRVESLESLLRRVAPQVNIEEEIGPSFNKNTWAAVRAAQSAKTIARPTTVPGGGGSSGAGSLGSSLHVLPQARLSVSSAPQVGFHPHAAPSPRKASVDAHAAQEDQEASDKEQNFTSETGRLTKHLAQVEHRLEELTVSSPMEKRFHGKSSGVTLVQAALTLKEEVTGVNSMKNGEIGPVTNRRPRFWKPSPWEWMSSSLPSVDSLKFPPADLLNKLVDHCFDDVLTYMPVLHRPSFEKDVREERHRQDIDFARLLLIVCAVGSRYCENQRVCLTSPEGEVEWSSAGWVYFAQVYQMKKALLASVKLVDLQIMALSATYLQGTSAPHASWLIVGIGLRFAEDIGAHREKVYGKEYAFENQLWKRAFWALVVMDKLLSASLGRPTCINDEDIDAHLPLAVDDDCWHEDCKQWVQPAGKPSQLEFFIHNAKLVGILAHAMRTIYSINKSKVHLGFIGPEWEQHTVAELDSALNQWLDAVPDHLRWDSHMQGPFYRQAAALRISFYYVQITVHRPFIQLSPGSRRVSPLSLPSLAICANAARSSAHILNTCMEISAPATWSMMAFISGLVLMISIWEARRAGLNVDVSTQVADVHTCLRYLRRWEKRTHLSGRLYDILRETASMGEVPVPPSNHSTPPDIVTSPTFSRKRDRDSMDSSIPEKSFGTNPSTLFANTTSSGSQYGESISTPTSSSSRVPASPADSAGRFGAMSMSPTQAQPQQSFVPVTDPTQQRPSWAPAAPTANVYNLNAQSTMDPSTSSTGTWENYHIAGSNFPGLNTAFQRTSAFNPAFAGTMDPMSPNSFLADLLGPLPGGDQNIVTNTQPPQPNFWSSEPMAQWNWMSDMTSTFGMPPPQNM